MMPGGRYRTDMDRRLLQFCFFALLVVAVRTVEESADPTNNAGKLTIIKLEEAEHGPLMHALLTPLAVDSNAGSTELQREKRHRKWYGGGGGGCGYGCGGGGGYYARPATVIVVPVKIQKGGWGKGGGGGGCGYGGCGGGRPTYNQYPSGGGYCNTCGGGNGGGSYSYSQSSASSSSGSWGGGYGKK